ncbi:hypothetical protein OSB04_013507 [Centaurea solstitialis]|uniref:Uncharacterized protein n=1 Tax=Centaurea solstitialis TaxID=347529 RepID=A0AA38TY53_9ASTR|nr:hypothetical protein OSB04_013507 [Centaurea solstitialis]
MLQCAEHQLNHRQKTWARMHDTTVNYQVESCKLLQMHSKCSMKCLNKKAQTNGVYENDCADYMLTIDSNASRLEAVSTKLFTPLIWNLLTSSFFLHE